MTDQWVPAPPQPPGPPPPANLPPANAWSPVTPCAAADSPSIVPSVIITGRPAIISAMPWTITLNDGGSPANFTIDHYDATGALIDHPMEVSGVDGSIAFNDPVTLSQDPVAPLEAATKRYVDAAPPGEAPNDGSVYGRGSASWVPVTTGGPYLPLTGGSILGNLTVTGVMSVLSSNSLVLNALTAGQQRGILAQSNGSNRWQMILADGTAETGANAGSNFALNPLSDTGGMLTSALAINRATSAAAFGGPVTMNAGAAVNGNLALQGAGSFIVPGGASGNVLITNGAGLLSWGLANPGGPFLPLSGGVVSGPLVVPVTANFMLGGGTPGQVLTTNGASGMSWTTPASAPGGTVPEAPNDGTFYARGNTAWTAVAIQTDAPADSTFWGRSNNGWQRVYAASNPSGYQTAAQVTAVLPIGSSTPPLMNGTAAVGTGATWARADHVHPVDTSRYAASNPSGYQTAAQVTAALPVASSTPPLASGVAAVGTAATYARADHVHPTTAMNDNRIINGDMRIDQRNNGVSGAGGTAYTVDRWQYLAAETNSFAWGRNLNSVTPPPAFPYCLGAQSQAAYTPLATDYFGFTQSIEADMISDFQWGAAGAQPVTLSFWALATTAGTYSGSIRNYAGTRAYPFTYTLAASAWARIVVTIPGDTTGAWVLSGNAGGAWVSFDLGCGATFRGPAGAWGSGNFIGATGAVSVVAINAAQFFVTGVKLEIGSVATPFNRQSLAKSLADCQRYYQKLGGVTVADIFIAGYANGPGANFAVGLTIGLSAMRAAPTATIVGAWVDLNAAQTNLFPSLSTLGIQIFPTAAGSVQLYTGSASTYLTLSAEL